jgi:FkbM family methyltransferase
MPLRSLYNRFTAGWRSRRRFWKWTDEDAKRARFYEEFIRPDDLVFDVGANLGNRTKVFCELGARVVAFEPQTACYEFLTRVFARKQVVRVEKRALGRECGTGELRSGENHTLASLSTEWIAAVLESGRFGKHAWARAEAVDISTLDRAIAEFGIPAFIKIDVEGFELEVLSGLSRPVPCLSVEFASEYISSTLQCLDRLSALSAVETNISYGESCKLHEPWIAVPEMKSMLCRQEHDAWGDVYIRCAAQ